VVAANLLHLDVRGVAALLDDPGKAATLAGNWHLRQGVLRRAPAEDDDQAVAASSPMRSWLKVAPSAAASALREHHLLVLGEHARPKPDTTPDPRSTDPDYTFEAS
jgi:hypothetical protein